MRINCPLCRGTKFVAGRLTDTADHSEVKFREKTSFITSNWTDISARMCVKCGNILLLGEIREIYDPEPVEEP